jgi:hypothetical protein
LPMPVLGDHQFRCFTADEIAHPLKCICRAANWRYTALAHSGHTSRVRAPAKP